MFIECEWPPCQESGMERYGLTSKPHGIRGKWHIRLITDSALSTHWSHGTLVVNTRDGGGRSLKVGKSTFPKIVLAVMERNGVGSEYLWVDCGENL
jgi:hypothetical protein